MRVDIADTLRWVNKIATDRALVDVERANRMMAIQQGRWPLQMSPTRLPGVASLARYYGATDEELAGG